MRNRIGMLRELRESLVQEEMALGKPREWAEALATKDLAAHAYLLRKRSVLRLAVQESRLMGKPVVPVFGPTVELL